ncbi:MAG TPA: hypothetical protein ENK82_01885 [Campylobacterales bacterium]|nr:hypothetical protein [Campylobacterales bacterium]HHS92073.1 hypothetical protein [Campylobacterales bacterium]
MKQMTLRAYAQKHKISFFNVMKMVKSKALKTITVEEDGKEVEYILLDEETEKKVSQTIKENETSKMSLEEENTMLKEEVKRLKIALEKCNKRTILA